VIKIVQVSFDIMLVRDGHIKALKVGFSKYLIDFINRINFKEIISRIGYAFSLEFLCKVLAGKGMAEWISYEAELSFQTSVFDW
jgi:hypothetical protein